MCLISLLRISWGMKDEKWGKLKIRWYKNRIDYNPFKCLPFLRRCKSLGNINLWIGSIATRTFAVFPSGVEASGAYHIVWPWINGWLLSIRSIMIRIRGSETPIALLSEPTERYEFNNDDVHVGGWGRSDTGWHAHCPGRTAVGLALGEGVVRKLYSVLHASLTESEQRDKRDAVSLSESGSCSMLPC